MNYIAHIKNTGDNIFEIQSLEDHLKGTSSLDEKFASKFNNPGWGRLLGLRHNPGRHSDECLKGEQAINNTFNEVYFSNKTNNLNFAT